MKSKKKKISPSHKGINNSTSKYLKGGLIYELNFTLDHLIKIDPLFNAEVTIIDDEEKKTLLNTSNAIAVLKGNHFKIKSNIDTMVYFYGKLFKTDKD